MITREWISERGFVEIYYTGDASLWEKKLIEVGVDGIEELREQARMLREQGLDQDGGYLNQFSSKGEKKGRTLLHVLASRCDVLCVTELIKGDGAQVDKREEGRKNRTALHFALDGLRLRKPRKVIAVIHALIEGGADVNAQNSDGETPLFLAARSGDAAIVQALIDKGADVNLRDVEGITALELAVEAFSKVADDKYAATVEAIVDSGACDHDSIKKVKSWWDGLSVVEKKEAYKGVKSLFENPGGPFEGMPFRDSQDGGKVSGASSIPSSPSSPSSG